MNASVHASAVVIGEQGVLLRGAPGSGKSALARALVARAAGAGRFAALVGDDRVIVRAFGGRLIARPHPAIAGRMELRGLGVVAVRHEGAARLALIVDLLPAIERLPARHHLVMQGIEVPTIALLHHGADGPDAVLTALEHFRNG